MGCLYGHCVASTVIIISTGTGFRRALTASVDSCEDMKIECSVSGVTSSGRVWRKVPESDARSVGEVRDGGTAAAVFNKKETKTNKNKTNTKKLNKRTVHTNSCLYDVRKANCSNV